MTAIGEAARLDEAYIGNAYTNELTELRQRIEALDAEAAITRRRLASLRGRMDSAELSA